MSYQVLSIGDAEMLYNAFQGVAMIFGNNSLNKLIGSGFALGTMLISMRFITDQEFPLRYALMGIIMYASMFTPKDTVIIEDVYTGEVRVVANIPLGVAVPMSVITTMGIKMTEMFQTVFSTPSEANLLAHGYLDSLNTLIKLRKIGTGTFGSSDTMSGDLSRSINAYIESCVMFDLEIATGGHEVTRESLQKSPDLWAAMRTTFINRDILVYLPNAPGGSQKSCKDAYEAINDYISSQSGDFKTQWDAYMRGILGINDPSVSPDEKIDIATQALSLTGIDAQTYMRNALMASYLKDGPSAFIKRPGMEQLNMQWAGEQTMFNEISRPLMAFVEMFTVATSPIVAFLSTLGPIGMTMTVRYVQMMLWIALWGPIMAVCNLYITVVTTRILTVMDQQAAENGSGLSAMVMHDQLYQTLETWLSTGSMLASSVPALSLMMVYGGSVAATNLSSKMTSAASSSVDPKKLAPDPISMDSPMKLGSMTESSANVGTKKSGMADTMFSASSTFGRASQSAADSMRSASSTASQTLNSMTQSTQRAGSMSSDSSSVLQSLTNSKSESDNWAASTARTIGDKIGSSQSEKEAISAGVGAALGAGLSTGKGISPASLGASAEAQLQSSTGMDAAKAKEISAQVQNVWNKGYEGSSQVSEMQQSAQQHSDQSFFGSEEMKSKGEQYLSQLQAVSQASEKFTQTASMQDSAGMSLSLPYQDLARRLNNSGAIADINNANQALESNMSADEKASISAGVQYDINRSSASGIVGGDREALAGFLKLNQQDPVKAAEILNNAIAPESGGAGGSGVSLTPSSFKGDSKSVDGIVDSGTANSFRSKAGGEDEGLDIDGGTGSRGKQGSMPKQPGPQQTTGKPSKDSKLSGLTAGGQHAQDVENALKGADLGNPDNFRKGVESGGKIDNSKDMSGMMGRAAQNEGSLVFDNIVKPTVDSAKSTASSIATAAYAGGKALDKALGLDTTPKHVNNVSSDDLPPIKK